MNRLAEALNSPVPTMAVTFTEPMEHEVITAIARLADVAELRADKFPSSHPSYLAEQAGKLAVLPLLLTIRSRADGGEWTATEEDRLLLFSQLLPQTDGVDVELSAGILSDVIDMAHACEKTVVVSSHDFNGTPSTEELEDKMTSALEQGADYVKFATCAKTLDDFQRLAAFTLNYQDENLIVVAMDNYGPLSRIALPAMGSRMTYAFAGVLAVAPGQLGYRETHNLLTKFYPDYAN